jgi:hypothetical protein
VTKIQSMLLTAVLVGAILFGVIRFGDFVWRDYYGTKIQLGQCIQQATALSKRLNENASPKKP